MYYDEDKPSVICKKQKIREKFCVKTIDKSFIGFLT